MAVLGLILLAAAGVLTAAIVTSNTNQLSVDMWGVTISDLTVGVVFVAGMITTVLAVLGLGMLMGAVRRGRRLRHERRELRQENKQLSRRVEAVDTPGDRPNDRPYEPAPARPAQGAPAAPVADNGEQHRTRSFLPRRDPAPGPAPEQTTTRG